MRKEEIEIDILKRIEKDFSKEEIIELIGLFFPFVFDLNVGANQYLRSLLFLANGSMEKVKKELKCDDPRDILCEAEEKSGNLNHWFSISYDEIEKLNGKKYIWRVEVVDNRDGDLPF